MHPITLRLTDEEHERGYRVGRFTESYGTVVTFCGCFTGLIGIHVAAHPSAMPHAQVCVASASAELCELEVYRSLARGRGSRLTVALCLRR